MSRAHNVYVAITPAEPCVAMSVRVHPSRRRWLDEVALNHHTDLSAVVRAALDVANTHPEEFVKRIEEAR